MGQAPVCGFGVPRKREDLLPWLTPAGTQGRDSAAAQGSPGAQGMAVGILQGCSIHPSVLLPTQTLFPAVSPAPRTPIPTTACPPRHLLPSLLPKLS